MKIIKFLLIIILIISGLKISACALSIYNGENRNQLALTFDDGPSFKYTDKVLSILKKERIKATFFIVGQKAEQYPEILKSIADQGHEIGNHTYHHSRLTEIDNNTVLTELEMTSSVIGRITGKKTVFFRPPFGWYTRAERGLIEQNGYKFVLWTVNADDFYHSGWGMLTPQAITKRVLKGVRGGDVILAHDDSEQLVEALPGIIESLKKRGYAFVTLSQLTGIN